jgi:hypothetical protein
VYRIDSLMIRARTIMLLLAKAIFILSLVYHVFTPQEFQIQVAVSLK